MKKLVLFLLLSCSGLWAQSFYSFPQPFPNATFYVCNLPANGNPCSNQQAIFRDSALTQTIPQPVTIGSTGQFGFWTNSGQYVMQIQSPYNLTYTLTLGGGVGGSLPPGTTTAGANVTFPGDVSALNHIATQPTDSLTFFTNPSLDPNCNLWNWNTSPPDQFLQLCVDSQAGQLTSMFGGANKIYYYGGAQQFPAHTFFGNNTGSSQPPGAYQLGTQDLTPNLVVAVSGVSSNALTGCPASASPTSLADGLLVEIELSNQVTPPAANTGSATFSLCNLAAKTIYKGASTGTLATLAANDLNFNSSPFNTYLLRYDGSEWVMLNGPYVTGGGGTGPVTITEGTITTSTPYITATQTLNNAATQFFNDTRTTTCTAAAANSSWRNWIAGTTTLVNEYFVSANCSGFRADYTSTGNTTIFRIDTPGPRLGIGGTTAVQWATVAGLTSSPTYDIGFQRFGAKTLGLCSNAACTDTAGLLLAGNTCRVTSAITLSTSATTVCTWSLPAVAAAWAWQCQIPYAITAGTTPTITLGMNASQVPTNETGYASINSTNTGTSTQGNASSAASGNVNILTGASVANGTYLASTSGVIQASATAGTFAITATLGGTTPAGTIPVGATCILN